jgi:hypothetical protein
VAGLVASNEPLRRAHAAWLAGLSLRSVLDSAHARGVITTSEVRAVSEAEDRSAAIARLRS